MRTVDASSEIATFEGSLDPMPEVRGLRPAFRSTAEAMREIDEAAINETIANALHLSKSFEK